MRHDIPARETGPARFPVKGTLWSIRGKMGGRTFGVQSLRVLACRALMSTLAGPEVLLSLLPLATLHYTFGQRFQARLFGFCASISCFSCS